MEQLIASKQDKMAEASQICMAHSATALNMMIGREIKISTPMLKVVNPTDIKNIITAFGMGNVIVQINFKNDFNVNNLLMLKGNDIKIIMDLMMGGQGVADAGDLNEMHVSCVSEVMNQMMGAAAIALTSMINKTVDINPPVATLVSGKEDIDRINYLPFADNELALVVFHFESPGLLKGIMVCIYSMRETDYICENFKAK